MVEGIPGSSPSWRGANMKTKGRCQPTDVPESRLGGSATGLAAWGTGSPDAQQETRCTKNGGSPCMQIPTCSPKEPFLAWLSKRRLTSQHLRTLHIWLYASLL
jgi:hypothetical protein